MEERRRGRRMGLKSRLLVKRLDSDEQDEIDVDILDMSKSGIGFRCGTLLEKGSIYEAKLTIWTKEVLHVFIDIVRMSEDGSVYEYGGLFVGMHESDLQRISVYATVDEELGRQS